MKKVSRLAVFLLLGACSLAGAQARDGKLFGRVATLFDEPLSGSSITIEALSGEHRSVATSGRDGRFQFGRIPPGRYRVAVSMPGFGREDTQLEVLPGEPTIFEIGLRFVGLGDWKPCQISGLVVDQHGMPAGKFTVVAIASLNESIKRVTTTGPGGRYSLDILYPGYYIVFVHRPGYAPSAIATVCSDEPDGDVAIDFEIRPAPR